MKTLGAGALILLACVAIVFGIKHDNALRADCEKRGGKFDTHIVTWIPTQTGKTTRMTPVWASECVLP